MKTASLLKAIKMRWRAGRWAPSAVGVGLLVGVFGCSGAVRMGADSAGPADQQFWPGSPQFVHVGEKVTIEIRIIDGGPYYLKLQPADQAPRYVIEPGK